MPSQTITLAALLALSTTISAQGITIGGSNINCDGTSLQDYCCPGSILSSGDYGNNNNDDVSGIICCVGDPNQGFNNIGGVTTCSAGTATPLTAVSGAATGAATSSPASSTESEVAVETTSSGAEGSEANTGTAGTTSSAGSTGSGMATSTTAGGAAARTSSASVVAQSSSSSSSSAGAAKAIVTGAPILGGAALGMLALL